MPVRFLSSYFSALFSSCSFRLGLHMILINLRTFSWAQLANFHFIRCTWQLKNVSLPFHFQRSLVLLSFISLFVISLFVWSRLTFILKMCPVALRQKALRNLAPVLLTHNFLSFFHLNAFFVVVIAADLATSFQVQELIFFFLEPGYFI